MVSVQSLQERLLRQVPTRLIPGLGVAFLFLALLFLAPGLPILHLAATARSSQGDRTGSLGIEVVLDAPEADVFHAVEEVANDQIVHGTYVYEREKTLTGAVASDSSSYFGHWQGPGKVLYKIYTGALAPRHFKDSSDIGTITVRYLVQVLKDSKTRVQLDAVFVEDGRRKVHESDGSVESSELKAIQDRLQQIRLDEQRAAEALSQRNEREAAEAALARQREQERSRLLAAQSSAQSLEQHVNELRHELVRLVANPGAELKSSPFHSAVSLQSLTPDSEVVILVVTPYWYGVETSAGRRGWVRRDQVKPLP